jgi:hypothetical protein
MALWPLVMYMIGLVWAYLSVPFEGHRSAIQNVVYGVLAAGPFWITILIFLVLVWREMRSKG